MAPNWANNLTKIALSNTITRSPSQRMGRRSDDYSERVRHSSIAEMIGARSYRMR